MTNQKEFKLRIHEMVINYDYGNFMDSVRTSEDDADNIMYRRIKKMSSSKNISNGYYSLRTIWNPEP